MKKCMVSACLLGEKCRYNGSDALSEKVIKLTEDIEVISFCPEVLAGMNTPREPSEIIIESSLIKVKTISGLDVTDYFKKGAEMSLDIAINEKVDLAILKSKSPSCGAHQIHDGTFSGNLKNGSGLTAGLFIKNNIPILTEEDL